MGEWNIEGVFLREKAFVEHHISKLYIKMDPSQFKNNMSEDIVVYETIHTNSDKTVHRQLGDVLRLVGQWEGREEDGHLFRFVATGIQSTGNKSDLNNIKLLSSAERFIRSHQ